MLCSFLNIGMMTSSTQAQKWSGSVLPQVVSDDQQWPHPGRLDRCRHRWGSPAGRSCRRTGQRPSREFHVCLAWQKIFPCCGGNWASLCVSVREGEHESYRGCLCDLTWSCPPMFWDITRTCWIPEINKHTMYNTYLFSMNYFEHIFKILNLMDRKAIKGIKTRARVPSVKPVIHPLPSSSSSSQTWQGGRSSFTVIILKADFLL